MARNFLRGAIGKEINPVLAAAAYNLRKLLAWFSFALNLMGLKPIISKIFTDINQAFELLEKGESIRTVMSF